MNSTLLRVGAALVAAIGSAAAVVADNPSLISAALPPHAAAAVTIVALILAPVLHELAHNTVPVTTAPADPAPPKESP